MEVGVINSLMINFIIRTEGQDSVVSVLVIHFLGQFVTFVCGKKKFCQDNLPKFLKKFFKK